MIEIRVSSWEECEARISEAREFNRDSLNPLLFRGQENAEWSLRTTWDRAASGRPLVEEHYRIISRIRPAIESLTLAKWECPEYPEIMALMKTYEPFSLDLTSGRLPAYSYMAYLRHHGFPSPLLDWSISPYVAAYFAFRKPCAREIAIYILTERPINLKARGSNLSIYRFGPYVQTHRRHHNQQSQYTICLKWESAAGWKFGAHEAVFGDEQTRNRSGQDTLWKLLVPASERLKMLRRLDEFNLNAFSLFGSEESLMEMLTIREIELRPPTPTKVGGSSRSIAAEIAPLNSSGLPPAESHRGPSR